MQKVTIERVFGMTDGRWNKAYSGMKNRFPYGDSDTYKLGSDWLSDCDVVEDWGCGGGWFSKVHGGTVVSVDGSESLFADKIENLTEYVNPVQGVFMRHVLEHNYDWEKILDNLLESFQHRAFICLFTPFAPEYITIEITVNTGAFAGIPDLALGYKSFYEKVEPYIVSYGLVKSSAIYSFESYFMLEK